MKQHGGSHQWSRSSYSGSGGSNCLEWRRTEDGQVAVRDSQRPHEAVLRFTPVAWRSFVDAVKKGTLPW